MTGAETKRGSEGASAFVPPDLSPTAGYAAVVASTGGYTEIL